MGLLFLLRALPVPCQQCTSSGHDGGTIGREAVRGKGREWGGG